MDISISLSPELVELIEEKIATGRYRSTSEVVRAALRLLQRAEQQAGEELRHAWQEGVASGDAGPLDLPELRRAALKKAPSRKSRRRNAG